MSLEVRVWVRGQPCDTNLSRRLPTGYKPVFHMPASAAVHACVWATLEAFFCSTKRKYAVNSLKKQKKETEKMRKNTIASVWLIGLCSGGMVSHVKEQGSN